MAKKEETDSVKLIYGKLESIRDMAEELDECIRAVKRIAMKANEADAAGEREERDTLYLCVEALQEFMEKRIGGIQDAASDANFEMVNVTNL